jgi:hypothetical protein
MAETTTIPRPSAAPQRSWAIDRHIARPMLLGWALLLATAHLTAYGTGAPRLLMVVESLVYLALYLGLTAFAPVRAWIAGIPAPHRAVLAGFVFCATWGQLVVDSRTTFPFTAWTMYARPEPRGQVDYYRWRGVDAAGHEVWVDPAHEFTFLNSAEIASRVKYIGRAVLAADSTPKAEETRTRGRAQLHDMLAALGTTYNRSHPDAPLRSLEFVHYGWDFRKQAVQNVAPESVLRIDIPEEASR